MQPAARRDEHDDDGRVPPALRPRPGGFADRFAGLVGMRHPAAVFFAALLSGFAVLAGVSILLGVFVTDVLVHAGGVGRTDESTIRSLVSERTPFLTRRADRARLRGAAALAARRLRRVRARRRVGDVPGYDARRGHGTVLESSGSRPAGQRELSVGHAAASIAVYAGLVYLLTSSIRSRGLQIAAWAGAVFIPAFVAMSRMYRGMHRPLDVAGGMVIGIGAMLVLLSARRERRHTLPRAHAAGSRAAGACRRRHEGRGRRARGQDARRRAAGAASHP